MRKPINYFLSIIPLLFFGCASFPKSYKNNQIVSKDNLTNFNGHYKLKPQPDSSIDVKYNEQDYANQRFYREEGLKGRGSRDTMKIERVDDYSFQINIKNEKEIEISYLKSNKQFRLIRFNYNITDDGFLLIKNRNLRVLGFPYIFGEVDIKKRRLSLDGNNLVIDEVYHSSGGVLIFLSDYKTWTSRHKYERIK